MTDDETLNEWVQTHAKAGKSDLEDLKRFAEIASLVTKARAEALDVVRQLLDRHPECETPTDLIKAQILSRDDFAMIEAIISDPDSTRDAYQRVSLRTEG